MLSVYSGGAAELLRPRSSEAGAGAEHFGEYLNGARRLSWPLFSYGVARWRLPSMSCVAR